MMQAKLPKRKKEMSDLVQHLDVALPAQHLPTSIHHSLTLAHVRLHSGPRLFRQSGQSAHQLDRACRHEPRGDDGFDDPLLLGQRRRQFAYFIDESFRVG